MGRLAQKLKPRKARITELLGEINSLEAELKRSAPITVIRWCRCGHAECGVALPKELPPDALLIEMGCRHEVPDVKPPPGVETEYRSRVERYSGQGIGGGLGAEGVKKTIETIRVLGLGR